MTLVSAILAKIGIFDLAWFNLPTDHVGINSLESFLPYISTKKRVLPQ